MNDYQLRLGDCLDGMRGMPADSVDVTITDPPYAEETHTGARTAARQKGNYQKKDPHELIGFKSFEFDDLKKCFDEIGRVTRTWVISFMDWRHIARFEIDPPIGLRFIRFGIWTKPNGAPQFTGDRPATGWEGIAIFHRIGGKMKWNGGGRHAVWNYNKAHQDSYFGDHPTVKPLDLMTDLVRLFSNEGDTVFDPFMGSGSTGVACVMEDRKFIGYEIDRHYFDISERRINDAKLQPKMIRVNASMGLSQMALL